MEALGYLLQVRASRSNWPEPTVLPLLAMVLIGLIGVLSWFSGNLSWAAVEFSCFLLGMISLIFVAWLPLFQLQQDAALHASFFAGRCYDEVLGTRLRPRELVDPIAFHSLRECFRIGLRPALMLCGLWWVLAPAWWMWILLALPTWILGLTWFLLPASYATQQWTIYNSQLKAHSAAPMLERLVAMIAGVPMLAMLVTGMIAFASYSFGLAAVCALSYFFCGVIVARQLALAGIARLPRLREKAQAIHRRCFGVRRNPFVYCWSDNPIVVRERQRDAGRLPNHWLGALLFLASKASGLVFLLILGFSITVARTDASVYYVILFSIGCAQLALACRRASGAIVDEAIAQSLELMKSTRLHASEFISGWLQVAAIPRMLESLSIFGLLYVLGGLEMVSPPLALLSAVVLLLLPLVGASIGLLASFASQREQASRRMSSLLMLTLLGYFCLLILLSGMLETCLTPCGIGLFTLVYLGSVLGITLIRLLNKIEIS